MNPIFTVIPEVSLSAAVDAEIRDLLCRCFREVNVAVPAGQS
jgi:hypothetical protein